jgi:hypothetical protein
VKKRSSSISEGLDSIFIACSARRISDRDHGAHELANCLPSQFVDAIREFDIRVFDLIR